MFSSADAEVLKPGSYSHNGNLIDPVTGNTDGDAALDFDTGDDESTFATAYHNDDGTSSEILFYNFTNPPGGETSFRLGINYSFLKNKGDDGFSIEYSTAGSTSCSDVSSRTWIPLMEATQETGKFSITEIVHLQNNPDQVCIKIDQVVNNDLDTAGYKFRDSNGLKIYDIWMEVAEADLEVNASTNPIPYQVGDLVRYHLETVNVGAGDASDVEVQFRLPDSLAYYSSEPSAGIYDPTLGVWVIGNMEGEDSATIEITAQIIERPFLDHIQVTAGLGYYDVAKSADESHATSVRIEVSENSEDFTILGEAPLSVTEPEQPEEILEQFESTQQANEGCDFDCERASFFLYIVNPDGTTRDTVSDFARVTTLEERLFHVSFEDKGADFDYDDIAFDLDLRDCRSVQVTMTDMNAGWHHQVRANIFYDGILQQGVVLWPDSHEGVGETLTFDLNEFVSSDYLTCHE